MSEIDWSKAPEGATHYSTASSHFLMKTREGWSIYYMCAWRTATQNPDETKFVCRHSTAPAWSSEGLPPVGTLCEICAEKDNSQLVKHEGKRARIVAHSVKIGGQKIAVYEVVDGAGNSEYHALPAGNFRPIRTPEQIAADERNKACDRMYGVILDNVPEDRRKNGSDIVEALYDAGLRFPE